MKEFRLFIASTLSNEYIFSARESIDESIENTIEYRINEFLKSLSARCQGLKIYTYRFEKDDANIFSTVGAQAEINRHIDESQAFVLLADSRIGKKTIEEFRHAKDRIMRDLNPSFITVFKADSPDEECRSDQEPFDLFCDRELKFVRYDENGKVQEDNTVYPYIFKSFEDLCAKLEHDIKHWLFESDRRPLFNAELGRYIGPDFFYTDPERLKNCHDAVYFHRDFDDRLYAAMLDEDKQVILLKGHSLSGKTRSLYQAVKNFSEAYFYRLAHRNDMNKLVEEINDLTGYITMSRNRSQLYLIIDDVHHLASNYEVKMAIQELRNAIIGKNIHLIMTSTSVDGRSDDNISKPDVIIEIGKMTPSEYAEAKLFCRRYEIEFRAGYQELGAMMIDLNQIAVEYRDFLNRGDNTSRYAKICLFQAVKAFSIWHNVSLGDVGGLFDFACFLLKTFTGIDNPLLIYEAFNEFIGLRGVNVEPGDLKFKVNRLLTLPKYVDIEEYIYRYILDYSGEITDGLRESSYEEEMALTNDILSYVDQQIESGKTDDTIIISLSKIARRAEHKDVLASAIYDIVIDILMPSHAVAANPPIEEWKATGWYRRLKTELEAVSREIEAAPDADNEMCSSNCIYLAKIFWAKMLLLNSFDQLYDLFNSIPSPLQSNAMCGALITKCEHKAVPEKVRNLARLKKIEKFKDKKFINSFYIINKVLPFYPDFQSAYDHFKEGIRPYASDSDYVRSASRFAQMLKERNQTGEEWNMLVQKDIRRQHFKQALNSLAQKVRNLDELKVLLGIIRDNFVVLLDNLVVAEHFITKKNLYDRSDLTIIDLLSQLSMYGTRGAVGNLFDWGSEVPEELTSFIDNELIPEFVTTLTNHTHLLQNSAVDENTPVAEEPVAYTLRHKAKHTVSLVFNVFIERCDECKFEDVKEDIFDRMEVQYNGRMINLRDSYTYSVILRNKKCAYIDAIDLYNNYIEPHSKEPGSHFRILRFILNEILNKVNSNGAYQKVSRLYDENNVARDRYSYNISLRNLDYDTCVRKILPKMAGEVDLDAFTLGELVAKAPNVKIAASYFKPLTEMGIRTDDNRVPSIAIRDVNRMIEDYTSDTDAYPLQDQHYLWATLVSVPCVDDEDREILHRALTDYLETEGRKNRIFGKNDGGIIYNNCLKNRTFIRSYEEAVAFMNEKNVKFDNYTFTHLQNAIRLDYAGTEDLSRYLTRLYSDHKDLVQKQVKKHSSHFYNDRLRVYGSYQEKLPMFFVHADGRCEAVEVTPLEYLRYLVTNNLPCDKYTSRWYVEISSGNTPELLKEFIGFAHSCKLPMIQKTVDEISRTVNKMIPADERVVVLRKLYELPVKDALVTNSQMAVRMYVHGLYDLEQAFEMIEGNPTCRLNNYTQLLAAYRKLEKPERLPDGGFYRALALYELYVEQQGIAPNPDIFSNLANLAINVSQLKCVFDKMAVAKVKPVGYILTPVVKVSKTVDEVKYFRNWYLDLGGKPLDKVGAEREVEALLRGLTIISGKNPSSDVHGVLGNLKACLLDTVGVAITYNTQFPCFAIYEREGCIMNQNSLADLLGCWTRPDDDTHPRTLYLDQTSRLLAKFYCRGNDDVNRKIISKVLRVAKQLSITREEILQLFYPYPRLAFMYAANSKMNTYEEYKILVESWNANFDRLPEDYAMTVIVDMLQRIKGIGEEVLSRMLGMWDTGITLGDCLAPGDAASGKYQSLTAYKDNEILRRKRMDMEFADAISESRNPVGTFVRIYGDEFTDIMFFKQKLDDFCMTKKPDFASLKRLLSYVSRNPDSILAVLEKMSDKWSTYAELKYILNALCNEDTKLSETLVDKLVFTIARRRFEELKINLVYEQILRAVTEGSLCISDFACSPMPAPRDVTSARMPLSAYWVRICKLLYEMSSLSETLPQSERLASVERLICDFYLNPETPALGKMDTAIVQEFLGYYISAYNACERRRHEDTEGPRMFEAIRTIMSTSLAEKDLDVSILFSESFRNNVNKPESWYKVRSVYISRIVLSKLVCDEKDKADMVISSRSHRIWIPTVYKGNYQKLKDFGKFLYSSELNNTEISFYFSCLFNEAGNVNEFMHAVREVTEPERSHYYIDNKVIINAIIRIVGQNESLIDALLSYNDKRIKAYGRSGDIASSKWHPDREFFYDVMQAESLRSDVDDVMMRCFTANYFSHPMSNFMSDLKLMREIRGCSINDAYRIMDDYVYNKNQRFNHSNRIENGFVIAEFLKATRTASSVTKQIMDKSAYNGSMLPICEGRADIFSNKMDGQIFKELSRVVEINREKGFSQITTQRLLHKLLMSCGPDFVLNDSDLLAGVARTICSIDEYKMFVTDLMKFYIPVSHDLTVEMVRALSRLIRNNRDWMLKRVVSRVKALAEYDSYFQGVDCHDFKAGYLLYDVESKIDFTHVWTSQSLHINKGHEVIQYIKDASFADRIASIKKIDSPLLRYEVLLMFLVNNGIMNKFRYEHDESLGLMLDAIANSADPRLSVMSVSRLFDRWAKNRVIIYKELGERTLLTIIGFYQSQLKNPGLGAYYREIVSRMLRTLRNITDKSMAEKKPKTLVYYTLFMRNNRYECNVNLQCDTQKLDELLNQ